MHKLYGVDLNAEAIQICQLSLWIKTAARAKQLTSLDHTIREGNSVILPSKRCRDLILRVWHVNPLRRPPHLLGTSIRHSSFIIHPFRYPPAPDYENVLTD